jgi:flagellar hook protein FlgE
VSISSSMNASVAGLSAQASHLATISDNIANSQTAGYKRASTDFAALVLTEGGGGSYTAGGVRTANLRLVEDRGSLTTTTNATDIAIAGRGMLPVTSSTAIANGDAQLPFRMTTTGSFKADAEGYLRTPTGLVLMGVPVDATGVPPDFPRTTATALEPVRISTSDIASAPTTRMDVAVNLPATGTQAGAAGTVETLTVEYYDNLGLPQTLDYTFTPTVPVAPAPPSNEWTLTVTDDASGGAVVGEYVVTFDDSPALGGTIASVATTSGGAYDSATGSFVVTTASGPIEIGIGLPGQQDGFTQLGSSFAPISMSKDGAPAGTLSGVEVDPAGFLIATYSSGETRRLYQIPVVDVPNPNGLTAMDNQTYSVSRESGAFMLWDAGSGPTGEMVGFAREDSTVDVAQELTQLIRTQRAYSSNAKVIQTVDEMFQETTNIKR